MGRTVPWQGYHQIVHMKLFFIHHFELLNGKRHSSSLAEVLIRVGLYMVFSGGSSSLWIRSRSVQLCAFTRAFCYKTN